MSCVECNLCDTFSEYFVQNVSNVMYKMSSSCITFVDWLSFFLICCSIFWLLVVCINFFCFIYDCWTIKTKQKQQIPMFLVDIRCLTSWQCFDVNCFFLAWMIHMVTNGPRSNKGAKFYHWFYCICASMPGWQQPSKCSMFGRRLCALNNFIVVGK